jgi:peptidoglycan/LPS O-acetylase OafA/YrhL
MSYPVYILQIPVISAVEKMFSLAGWPPSVFPVYSGLILLIIISLMGFIFGNYIDPKLRKILGKFLNDSTILKKIKRV